MSNRHAACSCGQLRLTVEGEPVRVSICHCLACQRRTGSV
ncbi:MAG: aldehyde-activating protein, partial [Gaiellaceae bacterium]